MALELMIVADPCRGLAKHRSRVFGVQGGAIGRSPDSYWVLPDPNFYVSATIAGVEFTDGGTAARLEPQRRLVNGAKTPSDSGDAYRSAGDRIRLAEYEILARRTTASSFRRPRPSERYGARYRRSHPASPCTELAPERRAIIRPMRQMCLGPGPRW
jgi:predicted component of type VI protein secretion system